VSAATALNRRLLDHLRRKTTDRCESERRIPASVFTCPDTFARERHALFYQVPQPVAFSGEIAAPGSYLALQALDTPVLLARDEQGKLRAFINACAHRGAPVAAGSGEARSLVCPFHGWAYRLDGNLRGRPEDDCFSTPASDCGLTRLPVSERYGVVIVGLDPAMPQSVVDDALAGIADELATAGLENCRSLERRHYTVAANWKLVTDLSLESYHFKVLHRDSVAQVLYANAIVDTFTRHSRWAFPLQTIERLADIPEAEWPEAVQGSLTYTLYPGVMFLVNALGAQMIRAEPGAHAGEALVTYAGMHWTDCEEGSARQAYEFGGDVFAREDLPMAEACQRGLAAGQRDMPLGRNEPLLQFWHRLWQEAISQPKSAKPESTGRKKGTA